MEKLNEIRVRKTQRGPKWAHTIQIVVYGRTFSMGTGGSGLTYKEALKEAKEMSDRLQLHLNLDGCSESEEE